MTEGNGFELVKINIMCVSIKLLWDYLPRKIRLYSTGTLTSRKLQYILLNRNQRDDACDLRFCRSIFWNEKCWYIDLHCFTKPVVRCWYTYVTGKYVYLLFWTQDWLINDFPMRLQIIANRYTRKLHETNFFFFF